MKKNGWSKAAALVLTLALLVGMVGALSYDRNSDGKTNVWDLQMMINGGESAEEQAAGLKEALDGKSDELHPNAEGVYEIWSSVGLYNMAKLADKGYRFQLMADIDLQGADWTPVASFKGTFDGNLHTISNLKITKLSGIDMGFFAKTGYGEKSVNKPTTVKDLNLRDVKLTVAEGSQYAGLLVGSNWGGMIENCTATGVITDSRTVLAKQMYIGALAGRNANSTVPGPGTIASGTNLITAQDAAGNAIAGLSAQVALDFAQLDGSNSNIRHMGIAGYSNEKNIDKNMTWQDVTNATSRLSATEQQRRQIVVDTMYEMGTVQWTPSELVTFTRNGETTNTHSNIYIPGVTYYGIPYNGVGGGYVRAMSIMQPEKDDQGRYVTKTGLQSGVKDDDAKPAYTGFIEYMGNDCSSAVGWAWAAAAPSRIANNGVRVSATTNMIPNDYNTKNYGVYPSGGYQTLTTTFPENKYPPDASDTQSIIALNGGAQGMADYYAKAGRGDALLCVEYAYDTATETWVKGTGHARMLAYEPVVIRNYKGVADLQTSYAITHEQGDGLFDNRNASGKYDTQDGYNIKPTSWRIDYKYPLDVLLTEEAYNAANKAAYSYGKHPGCGWGYVPVTIAAFTQETMREPYCNDGYVGENLYHPVILPNIGWNYSNWMIASATMTIKDEAGNILYKKTGYPMGRTYAAETLKLDECFPDAEDNLTAGQTYFITLEVLAGNGQTLYGEFRDHLNGGAKINKLNNFKFVYTPVE